MNRVEDLEARVGVLESLVEQLQGDIQQLRLDRAAASTVETEGFTVVASGSRSSSGSAGSYNDLAERIPPVPEALVHSCNLLRGGRLSSRERAARAWESGYWARFCLQGLLQRPRPSKPIDLSNQYYIILRLEGRECPILCSKGSDYRYFVGDLKDSTLSHGFPSLAEAKIYCQAADVSFPTASSSWNS
eukprot:Skav232499  [mRNA]  locus=scaffold1096:31219:31785:+ [translate_table: standard]